MVKPIAAPLVRDTSAQGSSIVASAAAAAAVVAATVAAGLPTLCPFRICTGSACPGCGLSRSLWQLAKGDLAMSLRYHPLLLPVLIQVLVIGTMRHLARDMPWFNKLLSLNLVVFLVVWIARWNLGLLDLVLDGRS